MIDKAEALRCKTGIVGLDDVLHGGLIKHRLDLLDGDPGSGKTTLALQFLLQGVRDGERCLYVTLSETRDELLAGARSHGWSLDEVEIAELAGDDQELNVDSQLTLYHPSEVELTETTRRVLDIVERENPDRMVFDSLSELRLLAQASLRYRRQILALKQFFARRKCTDYPEIRFEEANALRLPHPDGAFDVALLSMTLHHLEGGVHLCAQMPGTAIGRRVVGDVAAFLAEHL